MNSSGYIGNRNFLNPIIVLGPARSGTSMVTGILAMSGAWTGPTTPPSHNNIKGFFENRSIKDVATYRVLRNLGYDRRGQDPIPIPGKELNVNFDVKSEIGRVINSQGYNGKLWLFKDAKITLIWPIWYKMFPKADWIICCRKDDDIIRSCKDTKFMNRLSTYQGWKNWLYIHYEHIKNFEKTDAKIHKIDTSRLVKHDFVQLREVLSDLNLYICEKRIKEFIVPEAWKGD